jgi:diacylglycerol kinase (ATP)
LPRKNGHFANRGAVDSCIAGRFNGIEREIQAIATLRRAFSSTKRARFVQIFAVRTCIIFNPTAKGNKARKFRRHLDDFAADCTLKLTAAIGDARKLATRAVEEGFEIVVAAGGDGTLNEVLNGIVDAPNGFTRARLGVLPLGTVNVFAREVKIPLKLADAWKTLRTGRETLIDLGVVDYQENGIPTRRYFAQLAGAGLDARAIELVDWRLKKKIGPLAYVVAGLRALLQSQTKITVNAGQSEGVGELVLIGNGSLYGGDFRIFPPADMRDGLLDACVFSRVNFFTLLRVAPRLLFRGTLPNAASVNYCSESLTLTSASKVPFEVDGEFVGYLPATFSMRRLQLRVIVPPLISGSGTQTPAADFATPSA